MFTFYFYSLGDIIAKYSPHKSLWQSCLYASDIADYLYLANSGIKSLQSVVSLCPGSYSLHTAAVRGTNCANLHSLTDGPFSSTDTSLTAVTEIPNSYVMSIYQCKASSKLEDCWSICTICYVSFWNRLGWWYSGDNGIDCFWNMDMVNTCISIVSPNLSTL